MNPAETRIRRRKFVVVNLELGGWGIFILHNDDNNYDGDDDDDDDDDGDDEQAVVNIHKEEVCSLLAALQSSELFAVYGFGGTDSTPLTRTEVK